MTFHEALQTMINFSKENGIKTFVCQTDNTFFVEGNGRIIRMGIRLCKLQKAGQIAFNNCDFNHLKQRIQTKCDRFTLVTPLGDYYVINPRNYGTKYITIKTERLLSAVEWYGLASLELFM